MLVNLNFKFLFILVLSGFPARPAQLAVNNTEASAEAKPVPRRQRVNACIHASGPFPFGISFPKMNRKPRDHQAR